MSEAAGDVYGHGLVIHISVVHGGVLDMTFVQAWLKDPLGVEVNCSK